MEEPGTIMLVGDDKALDISRAIIETHKYYVQNVAILNDRERGYFFNEYFPAVKRYLEDPAEVLIPMEPETHEAPDELAEFRHRRGAKLTKVNLAYVPEKICGVCIANNRADYKSGRFFCMEPSENYTFNLSTGVVFFHGFFTGKQDGECSVFDDYEINEEFSIFVRYKASKPRELSENRMGSLGPYKAGEDGEQ